MGPEPPELPQRVEYLENRQALWVYRVYRVWVLRLGFWVLGLGFCVLGFGFGVLRLGFWVLGLGFRPPEKGALLDVGVFWNIGYRPYLIGFRAKGLGLRVFGRGFWVQGFGFRIHGLGVGYVVALTPSMWCVVTRQ